MRMNMKQQQQRRDASGSVTGGVREKKRREKRFICFSQCEVSQGPTWERDDGWGASICLASVPQSLSPTASELGLPKAHITYSFLPSLSGAVTACIPHTPERCTTQTKGSEMHSTSCLSVSNTNANACTPNIIPQPDILRLTRRSWAIGLCNTLTWRKPLSDKRAQNSPTGHL